jgi:hypothetical protein
MVRIWLSAAAGGARVYDFVGWFGDQRALVAARLAGRGATVHEFNPFEVVPDEVIEGRCCYFHAGPVCEGDCHSTSFAKLKAKLNFRTPTRCSPGTASFTNC